jgi:ATP-dependent RNA helicase DeaD
MTEFSAFGLAPALLQAITDLGFEKPTPVQSRVIPMLLGSTRDLVALAQTGTGKTAAYGLPLLQLTDPGKHQTQALILCPTRELCVQITKDLTAYARHLRGIRVVAVYGGASIGEQIRALGRGAHIIVATPGRMHDLLRRQRADLSGVQRVVLDEADEMMNMGFQEEMEAILKEVPDGTRTLLFSATMPRQVAAMAGKYMHNPEEILLGQRNSGSDTVDHECYKVHARERYAALRRIIDFNPGFYGIVFCRTRAETQDVASHLTADGYNADALHGDLTQDQRDRVMNAFRVRTLQILVATDVAARGLDVNDLTHVINYNLPDEAELYTHRSGRTGRAGKAGTAIAIINFHEEYKLRIIERMVKKQFVHKPLPTGRQVCEAQLASLLERVKAGGADDARLDAYMPMISSLLAELSKEDVVKRFVLREFDRFLTYYQNAPDLNAGVFSHGRRDRPAGPAGRERYDRRDGAGGGRARTERFEGRPDRFRVNLGRRNELTPAALISLINRATRGPMLRVGRIHIMEQSAVFEMMAEDAREVLPHLNRAVFGDRAVRVEAETGAGSGPGHPHARGPRPAARPPFRSRGPGRGGSGPGGPAAGSRPLDQ